MIAVCWRWVSPEGDERWGGVSDADRAALELALRLADGAPVTVVALGPAAAEVALREALAAGAARAVRIDAPTALASAATAQAIAEVLVDLDPDGRPPVWVLCGDYSSDRGSGSCPAFIAAALDIAQALGLVEIDEQPPGVRAIRRLDGGRREELEVTAPAVLSVEGSLARLRRASPAARLAADTAAITVVPGPTGPLEAPLEVRPYRPRPRVLPPPSGTDALARVRAITGNDPSGAGVSTPSSETVHLDPAAAARRLLDALRAWGYLDSGPADGPDASARQSAR